MLSNNRGLLRKGFADLGVQEHQAEKAGMGTALLEKYLLHKYENMSLVP